MTRELVVDIYNFSVVNRDDFKKAWGCLKNGKYQMTIKDIRKRSVPQNSYYWGVIVEEVRKGLYEIGYQEVQTAADAHLFIKTMHLRKEFINIKTGEMFQAEGSTTELSIPEFNEFIERVIQWAAEWLGISIPSPNEQYAIYDKWEEDTVSDATGAADQ